MRSVVITGASGGIGQALAQAFAGDGSYVVGIDQTRPDHNHCHAFISHDLAEAGRDEASAARLCDAILAACGENQLEILVNNAAVQHLGVAHVLAWNQWRHSLDVNLGAPFALARGLYSSLAYAKGAIINIGSVHATATKPGFAAYATSKAALHGLTRALALDFGADVRVMTLAPAAVDTPMLRAGFENNPRGFADLKDLHPAKRLAAPGEIAMAALYLASSRAGFMTGSVLHMDGGILSRLHDPA